MRQRNLCVVCAPPCMADEPLAGVLGCPAITDSAARTCFDRETALLASAPALSAAAAPTAPTAAAPAIASAAPVLDAQQSFGLSGSAIAHATRSV